MNKYIEAIEKIKNEYDAFYIENKYGTNTHQKEFDLLSQIKGAKVNEAIADIKYHYDCYYKNELPEGNPFDYLTILANMEATDE